MLVNSWMMERLELFQEQAAPGDLILDNRNVELVSHVFEIVVDIKDLGIENHIHRDI